MAAVTIRNLRDETHRALKARAKRAGRSTEAEIRAILEEAVKPPKSEKGLGTLLHEFGQKWGPIEIPEDKSPNEPADFS